MAEPAHCVRASVYCMHILFKGKEPTNYVNRTGLLLSKYKQYVAASSSHPQLNRENKTAKLCHLEASLGIPLPDMLLQCFRINWERPENPPNIRGLGQLYILIYLCQANASVDQADDWGKSKKSLLNVDKAGNWINSKKSLLLPEQFLRKNRWPNEWGVWRRRYSTHIKIGRTPSAQFQSFRQSSWKWR